MQAVCFGSPKGGVGKTMLTANIAYALQRLGMKVIIMDFDPQNALRHHFGIDLQDGRGYVAAAQHVADWSSLLRDTRSGVRLLLYGEVAPEERRSFDDLLTRAPYLIRDRIRPLLNEPNTVLLADMPPGPSPALDAVMNVDPLCIAVLLADTASTALLPSVERGDFFGLRALGRTYYIVNQYDVRSALNRDVSAFLRERMGSSLLGLVHRDEAVKEAHARQISVFQHAYASAAVEDLNNIALNIQRMLQAKKEADEGNQIPPNPYYV